MNLRAATALRLFALSAFFAANPPFLSSASSTPTLSAPATLVHDDIEWPAFLARHDLVWEQLPRQWNEGAFAGNGNLGFMAYATLADNRFDFHLARADVTDHRKAPDRATSLGVPGASVMWDFPRLDIGRMALRPAGKILDGRLRMDLWNAELTGVIPTDLGELRVRALTLRDRMVHVFEVVSTERTADGKPAPWRWEFLPGNPSSPRALTRPEDAKKQNYPPNPAPRLERIDGLDVCVQDLLAGGDHATAWSEIPAPGANAARASRLYVSTANEIPASDRSGPRAVADVRAAASESLDALLSAHRAWWQTYHRRAFLAVPDARLESFYWIQMYKLACALRPDGPALDVLGPFYRTTPWPGIWWNLNIQLSYWPVYAGNRLELGENYTALLDARFDELLASFRGRKTFGDFVWALHNYWWQLRFAGDWSAVTTRWTPKAKATLAAFGQQLEPRADGRLGLAPMGSPEYKGFAPFPDTTYNLALLRWLLSALIEADAHAGRAPDPDAGHWRDLQAKLIDYPADTATGLRIAANQALEESHRHYSHLLPLYPLYQLDPDAPADRELVLKSVRHWHQLQAGKALAGYSFTGGASLYASLGLGDDALGMLNTFLSGRIGISQLHANTFYTESGGKNPVIETPLSAASATMDLLLQSWRDKIRVFPAVPSAWREATFRDLRAQGGFLISAAREAGATAWVAITSEAGEPCVVRIADWTGPVEARGARDFTVEPLAPGDYRVDLRRGETVLLFPRDRAPATAVVRALPAAADSANPYGVKRGGELKSAQVWPEPPPASLSPARD
ncbi:MAG: hypothetical protein H7067_16475 [Burkholderiales bacterium]|nr:hypothetical protein [Opitutaceae bacterium]